MRMLLTRVLSKMGHEVIAEAANGKEAREKYRRYKPDLTTMDITMPECDGIEAVKLICGDDNNAKIVMVTAIGQQPVLRDAIAAGALDFIVKPFEEAQVARTIDRILAK